MSTEVTLTAAIISIIIFDYSIPGACKVFKRAKRKNNSFINVRGLLIDNYSDGSTLSKSFVLKNVQLAATVPAGYILYLILRKGVIIKNVLAAGGSIFSTIYFMS